MNVTPRQFEALEAVLAGHAPWYRRDPHPMPTRDGATAWRTTSSQGGARRRMADTLKEAGLITEYERIYEPRGNQLTAAALRLLIARYEAKGDRLEHYDPRCVRLEAPYSMLEKARALLPGREAFERRRDQARAADEERQRAEWRQQSAAAAAEREAGQIALANRLIEAVVNNVDWCSQLLDGDAALRDVRAILAERRNGGES